MRLFPFLTRHLVYASCWEDPRIDRAALRIGPADTVLTITSAGCNALAYALDGPKHVYAVDLNYRQNALLELKLAGIRRLSFGDFFALFGAGYSANASRLYRNELRAWLTPAARRYWDRRIHMFSRPRRPFYFHGGVGTGAWLLGWYIDHVLRLRPAVDRLFAADTTAEQVKIYREQLRRPFWSTAVRWLLNNRLLLATAGIPAAQIRHARQAVPDVAEHLDRRMEQVLARCPLRDNCYWHVYLKGHYPRQTCPAYLEEGNFARLKAGLVDHISVHTSTVHEFLRSRRPMVSRFSLLDHFDWFCGESPRRLSQELQALVDCAGPGARFTWRSMGEHTDFVDDCRIEYGGATRRVGELMEYDHALAAELQTRDRVNSYSCLRIGEFRDHS